MNILTRKDIFSGMVISLCLIFMSGCSNGIKHYVRPNTDAAKIKKIAVLPFENFTPDTFADDKVRSVVIMDLMSRGVDVIEPGEVLKILQEMKVKSAQSLTQQDIKNIGEALNVESVMTGAVEAFGISRGISVSYPEVSVNLILFDAKTGKIIWSVWHTAGGASFWTRHFGAEGSTLDETSKKVIKEAIDTLF
ncbi:MAG: DUF799 family lipoprotein [Nitrospirae bacterium]|nr:DUF799 family lipoprotein [Nitrospirota bacterium]